MPRNTLVDTKIEDNQDGSYTITETWQFTQVRQASIEDINNQITDLEAQKVDLAENAIIN